MQARQHQRLKLQENARRILPLILQEFHWSEPEIAAGSPTPITLPVPHHYLHLLDLFDGSDIVWIGDRVNQTGFPWHRARFRTVNHWLGRMLCPGVFICPGTFAPGSFSRSGQNVIARKFLVVESDTLSRNQVGAVFRMLRDELGMRLRAVVDTGNRSLHAWFDMPTPNLFEGLETILPALGCDPAMLRSPQPCRLPGAERPETQRPQKLLYLDLYPHPAREAGIYETSTLGAATP